MLRMTVKCEKHPAYDGKGVPANCEACQELSDLVEDVAGVAGDDKRTEFADGSALIGTLEEAPETRYNPGAAPPMLAHSQE